jgi:hypothetical protein
MTEALYRKLVAIIGPATQTKQRFEPLETNTQQLYLEDFGSLFNHSAGARFIERFDYVGADVSFEVADEAGLLYRYTIVVPAPLTEAEWRLTMDEALGHAHAESDSKTWKLAAS